jgi:hypothetical protein
MRLDTSGANNTSMDATALRNNSTGNYKLHFEMHDDKPTGLTSTQPTGTFIGKWEQ